MHRQVRQRFDHADAVFRRLAHVDNAAATDSLTLLIVPRGAHLFRSAARSHWCIICDLKAA